MLIGGIALPGSFRTNKLGPWLDKTLARFKVGEAGRAEVQEILRSPRVWLKGEATALNHLAPWEKLLFFISGFTGTASDQWDGRDRLYRYTFGVNPNYITVSDIVTRVWDAINDPFIGQWMDRRPMRDSTYRRIVRANHAVTVLTGFFFLLDLGLTPIQRMVMYTAVVCVRDILVTMRDVAYTKYYAGITPYSLERGKAKTWENVGMQAGYTPGNIPGWIFGFAKDRQAWSDYRVFTRGYAITIPLKLCAGIVKTYAVNKVQFGTRTAADTDSELAEHEADLPREAPQLGMRESFGVLRHNKYMLYGTVANIVTMLTPAIDIYPIVRFMYPERRIFGMGDPVRGEGYMLLSKQFSGMPIALLYPFLGPVMKALGGAKKVMILNRILQIAMNLVRFAAGYKSVFALVVNILMDAVNETMWPLEGYAGTILDYEMYDYVEWKTGVRSEGITVAFKSFMEKIIANNLNSLTGNGFLAWTGINNIDLDVEKPVVPERYQKWAWPVYTLSAVADNLIMLFARMAFPYDPNQKDVIEADLHERRALAQAKLEEVREEAGG